MDVSAKHEGNQLELALKGELDHHGAKGLLTCLEQEIQRSLPLVLVLDFSGVTFMDSSGIAVALHTLQQMKQLGGKMRITNSPMQVKKVFAAAGIQKMIGMEDVT